MTDISKNMKITIEPSLLRGALKAPDSKSHAHRQLIAAALALASSDDSPRTLADTSVDSDSSSDAGKNCLFPAKKNTEAVFRSLADKMITDTSEDILATINCLCRMMDTADPVLDCGESGSTLRFLLPLSVAAGRGAVFWGKGKLPERPLVPLDEELIKHGALISKPETPASSPGQDNKDLDCLDSGSREICRISLPDGTELKGGEYSMPGHISSQYITGLLMALPLIEEDSCIRITTPLQSAAYIDITLAVLRNFGIDINVSEQNEASMPVYEIKGGQKYMFPGGSSFLDGITEDPSDISKIRPEGDWSNGAFWLAANALGSEISLTGLDPDSPQGDKAICQVISKLNKRKDSGTEQSFDNRPSSGCSPLIIDAADIPDLIPIISVLAALTPGRTQIVNAERLRIKESDRLATTCALLRALGADISETEDGLLIDGKDHLTGGQVDGAGDHRIVMAAAIAATRCTSPVTITGSEAVSKSYPKFFEHYQLLGGNITNK